MAFSTNANFTQSPASGLSTLVPASSWIAMFEYDPQNLRLTTHLKNGAIYQHIFVLPSEWTALVTSQHHSKHWSSTIKAKKQSIAIKRQKAPNSEKKEKPR
jgi:hypothetical protein